MGWPSKLERVSMKTKPKLVVVWLLVAVSVATPVRAAQVAPPIPNGAALGSPQHPKSWFDAYGATAAWERGFDGRGWSVVVMDEGIDASHPLFQGKIAEEVCTSSAENTAGPSARLKCPGGQLLVTGPGVSSYTPNDPYNEHGTKMAGAVLRWAPEVSIISIKSHGNHIAALDWVIANASRFKIAAVNMSFGGNWYPRDGFGLLTCDRIFNGVWAARFGALRSLGIAPVVAAMNDGQLGKVGWPACNSNAVSVGSHYLGASTVRVDSNVSWELSVLGPSGYVTSTNVESGSWAVNDGTSAAAPVVSALFAIGKQVKPTATVDELVAAARASGTKIDDVIVKDLRLIHFNRFIDELLKPTVLATAPVLKPVLSTRGGTCLSPSTAEIKGVRPPTIGFQPGTSEFQPTWYHCYGASKVWQDGYDGTGWSIAVLDNGIDRTHPLFDGRILEEVCTSQGQPGWMGCPGGQRLATGSGASSYDLVSGSLAPVPAHGTKMVGAALLWAPGAKVISIKSHGDHFAALDWVIANAERYKIAAVSMSFGQTWFPRSQPDPSNCNNLGDGDWTSRFKKLREIGVVPVVAAMNEGSPSNIGLPACNSYAVSVGSHFVGAPILRNESNVSPNLTLIGPSGFLSSTTGPYQLWERSDGTSTATPVVAAMFAIGRQVKPTASVDELVLAARESAKRVDDILVKDLRLIQFDTFVKELLAPTAKLSPKNSTASASKAVSCSRRGTKRITKGKVERCQKVSGRLIWVKQS